MQPELMPQTELPVFSKLRSQPRQNAGHESCNGLPLIKQKFY